MLALMLSLWGGGGGGETKSVLTPGWSLTSVSSFSSVAKLGPASSCYHTITQCSQLLQVLDFVIALDC